MKEGTVVWNIIITENGMDDECPHITSMIYNNYDDAKKYFDLSYKSLKNKIEKSKSPITVSEIADSNYQGLRINYIKEGPRVIEIKMVSACYDYSDEFNKKLEVLDILKEQFKNIEKHKLHTDEGIYDYIMPIIYIEDGIKEWLENE